MRRYKHSNRRESVDSISRVTKTSLKEWFLLRVVGWHSPNSTITMFSQMQLKDFGARQTLVEIVIFSVFAAKNLKSKKFAEICSKFLQKTGFFKFASKRWLTVDPTVHYITYVMVP